MTPDKARELLNTPQPDENDPSWDYTRASPRDTDMLEAADDMARTIANMIEEWGVEDRWGYVTWFSPTALNETPDAARRKAEEHAAGDDDYYLVRRYVTKPETVDED